MENANGVIKKLTSAERSYYTAAEVREPMILWMRQKKKRERFLQMMANQRKKSR